MVAVSGDFRPRLSRDRFARMCYHAARSSITCRGYIRGVQTRLCRWLDKAGAPGRSVVECEPGRGNVHRLVVNLYRLLEEKCVCDFRIEEVLNAYSPGCEAAQPPDDRQA